MAFPHATHSPAGRVRLAAETLLVLVFVGVLTGLVLGRLLAAVMTALLD